MLQEEIEKLRSQDDEFINYLLKMMEDDKAELQALQECLIESEKEEDIKEFTRMKNTMIGKYVRVVRILQHIYERL